MDTWYYPRKSLAEKYLEVLKVGISSNLAIIAPRRKGKTLFILNDISLLAKRRGYIPVYASLWQNINAPHEGLILALQEAISTLDKKNALTTLLKTKIKKASISNELIGKIEVEFADRPKEPSSKDLILLDQLLSKLQKKAKKKSILLLIDEVQHLATSNHFDSLTHSLRTMLDKRQGNVKTIFTGSSRHYMNLLFNESLSPFYHFVEVVPFPELDDKFINFISLNLEQHHSTAASKQKLMEAFASLDFSPYWMMKVISHMITFKESIKASLDYVLNLMDAAEGFERIAKKMKTIDKIVFLSLTSGKSPFSKEVLKEIDSTTTIKGVYPNVQRSLQRLIEQQLVSQIKRGEYNVEKPGLKRFLESSDH